MRSLLSLCLFLSLACCAAAQDKQNAIGLYTSFFNPDAYHKPATYGGGTSEKIKNTTRIGVEYLKKINRWLSVTGGVEYSDRNVEQTINAYVGPPQIFSTSSRIGRMKMVSVPISLRLDFLRYFFFTTGAIVDLDLKASDLTKSQSGIGASAGLGLKYDVSSSYTVFAQPYLQVHHIVQFETSNERLLSAGVKTGVMYRF